MLNTKLNEIRFNYLNYIINEFISWFIIGFLLHTVVTYSTNSSLDLVLIFFD